MEKSTTTIKKEHQVFRNKIVKGLKLSYNRLVKQRALENGELVMMVDGKVRSVKARKIKV
ncbi:MAG: hypothetical protein HOP30_01415 [Cyclobacteriaceae bacterium]|nr:hypothetical protein [Cyclobacteriaceae bacterium]